jgi:two-component system cell cycle sensor histidine kinase/response regulator CckA
VVLIIAVNYFISSKKVSALEYELLENNVQNIISRSESDNSTIQAIGMERVEFYREATKKGVLQDIRKNLSPGTSIAIFDSKLNELIFSVGDDELGQLTNADHIKAMVSEQSGLREYDLPSESGERVDLITAFGTYPNWDWLIVSFVNKDQLFKDTYDAMSLSFFIAGALFIFIFIAVYKLSDNVSRAISKLENGAHRLSGNDRDVEINIDGDNEFSRLATSFNTMASEIRFTEGQLRQSILEEKKANVALEESRKQYYDLIEGTPDLVTRVDAAGHLIFVNHAATKVYGLPAESCIGRLAFDFIHPDDLVSTKQAFALWLESEKMIFSFENRQVSIDGKVCEMAWSTHTEHDNEGKVCGFASTARDITEHKYYEEERNKLENQLHQSQKMKAVGELAGGVAHDFNNMLGVILGHAEIARLKLESSSHITSNLEEIIKASKHSADLTRQLLTFARKQSIEPRVLDLNQSVTAMFAMLKRLIGENIRLTFDQDAELWPVKVDPSQVDQILANLCVNARDAVNGIGKIIIKTSNYNTEDYNAEKSPPTQSSTTLVLPPGPYVQITVSDNGAGIENDVLPHIFEPFYTTKAIGQGTGLGLSTVFGAVKQNGGFIEVLSEFKQGAVFNIYFPRVNGAVSQDEVLALNQSHYGTETVLIVEDEGSLLDIETNILEHNGYNVLSASTVGLAEAHAHEYAGQIDLLLTDVIMPEMNGRELSEKLITISPGMKVLYMSGYTADIIATHGVISDDVQFLQKPFSIESLSSKVREVLDAAPNIRSLRQTG